MGREQAENGQQQLSEWSSSTVYGIVPDQRSALSGLYGGLLCLVFRPLSSQSFSKRSFRIRLMAALIVRILRPGSTHKTGPDKEWRGIKLWREVSDKQ
ncbi:hypothetical protein RRG08_003531 [Elysia crispata]|uniref:Uncharacterized protein n=1 Tax=Elysia crispata TaxID=231223 RepID=A0AAE0Y6N9_9GAST|nr:hypothetical protein RRG08_003531 [Elysia crispata]